MPAIRKKSASKRAPRRGERVVHILDESLACFAEHGFERVTYDDLIARSKVSRGSFYWYFPSKEALYDAVLEYCVSGYVARVEAQYAKTSARDPVIKRLLRAFLADLDDNRAQYRVLLRPPSSPGAIERLTQWNDDANRFIAGKLDRKAAEVLPDVLGAFIDGVCVRLVLDDERSITRLSRNIEAFLSRIVGS